MAETRGAEAIPQWKMDEVAELKDLVKNYNIFGVVSFESISADQLQKMRRNLRESAVLKVTRNTLNEKALKESDGSVPDMVQYIEGQTALIFTNDNPFKLYKMLAQTKTPAPIKAGAVAPFDITVNKGPTSFPPGPMLSEFQGAGIPTAVEGGKIAIKETKVVCKAGEKVSQKLANALSKLEIFPMEVGLILRAVYEDGTVYLPEVLHVDETEMFNKFVTAAQEAFNLSVNAAIVNKDNIEVLIQKAHTEAVNLGVEAVVFEPEVMDKLIGKANAQATSVAKASKYEL
ncbi:LSU ribosomal protein L10P [Methanimicrococcus blatticola]|uniref:Large ribosomal subunit protein uL10 n=1 Tax=Methanimicrococcus blatticola TaxID=91560 RepID=A0A484F3C7_9EURY|nr:50S ribosomal protein L10 [Methanimicrococcus blatticola]MBZ3935315.1 50S ribosomal protein L10 [Methanimicrococcus blatticola]MCC2508587.1 50S ribosomal protein L10 [Methanimicrococcus blatticola]TDQ67894.1 LSU ribosomal protein L10P [Methanimicrococcus blatticola]